MENSAQKYANNPYILEKKTDSMKLSRIKKPKSRFISSSRISGSGNPERRSGSIDLRIPHRLVISELGILYAGAVNVPTSILLKEGVDLKFRLEHSETRWIIISGNQLDKVKSIKKNLKILKK